MVGSGISESLTLFFLSVMPPGTVKNKYGTVLSFCLFWVLICSFCFVIVPCLFHHLKNLRQKVMCKIYIVECSITIFILPVFNTACESCPGCHVYHGCCFLCEVCTEVGKRVERQCCNT